MIWKNKKQTFAIKLEDFASDSEYGIMIRFLPTIDLWIDTSTALSFSWLWWSLEFWFGDVNDLV